MLHRGAANFVVAGVIPCFSVREQIPTDWRIIRFGVFETDLRAGEVRKCGIRIKFQSQPFKLLTILLTNAGEIVTREELQRQIWGSETVVNFDHSLGTAVNKVREALGDSAENPRYIETLAKRGYRFIAPVEVIESPDLPAGPRLVSRDTSSPGLEAASPAHLEMGPAKIQVPARKTRPSWAVIFRLALIPAILGALVFLCFSLWENGRAAKPLLLPFTQITSSDAIFPGSIGVERFPVLLTDGSRLYFSKIEGGRVTLAYSPISGGDVQPLPTPPEIGEPRLADISPDGSKLLVFGETLTELEGPMWIVPSVGGAARKIMNDLGHDGTWLPDGSAILYATGRSILTVDGDHSEPRLLTSVPGRAFWLRCAPDGSRLRFTVIDPVTHDTALWEFTFADKKLNRLLPGWSHLTSECCGNWMPDGKSYVFQSNRVEGSNLWILAQKRWFGAPSPTQVTAGPLNFIGPVPGRHPTQIFFTGAHKRSQLRRYDPRNRQFVPYLRKIGMAGRTEFSRDGTRVAWTSSTDGALWQSRLDGSQRFQLTSRPMRVFMMRWSPDSRFIAFMGKEPGRTWKIYVISAEGGPSRLVAEEPRSQADPDWSPDGQSLVFGRSSEYMAEDAMPKAIQMVDLRTREVRTLPGSEGLFSPRWSPNGRHIIAMPLDQRKLMLFDTASRTWTELASGRFNNPVWSKDSNYIYYQTYDEGSPIRRIAVAGGRIDDVADFRDLAPGTTVNYWGIGIDNNPVVSFDFFTADIYSVNWPYK